MFSTVVEKLNERGYNAELIWVDKPHGKFQGIRISEKDSNISPVIYTHALVGENVEDLVNEIIFIYKGNKNAALKNVNVENIIDNIEKNVFITLRKEVPSNFVSKKYLDLYEMLEIAVPEVNGVISVTRELAEKIVELRNISIAELFLIAEAKLEDSETFIKIEDVLDLPLVEDTDMTIMLWKDRETYGGNQLLNLNGFNKFCKYKGWDRVCIIPSSIHELILINPEEADIESVTSLIIDVNESEVAPEEVLSDHTYIYDTADNKIHY